VNSGRTVLSQLIEHLPEKEFQKCVARYPGDSNFRGFSCWDQLLAMAFAQLTYRESLRDIESCLRALQSKLYHMGFRGKVSRSPLADANESHSYRWLFLILGFLILVRSVRDVPPTWYSVRRLRPNTLHAWQARYRTM